MCLISEWVINGRERAGGAVLYGRHERERERRSVVIARARAAGEVELRASWQERTGGRERGRNEVSVRTPALR